MLANDCAACALDRSANTLWRKEGYYEVKKRLVTTKLSFNHLDLNKIHLYLNTFHNVI